MATLIREFQFFVKVFFSSIEAFHIELDEGVTMLTCSPNLHLLITLSSSLLLFIRHFIESQASFFVYQLIFGGLAHNAN